jgi:hypothetical protein
MAELLSVFKSYLKGVYIRSMKYTKYKKYTDAERSSVIINIVRIIIIIILCAAFFGQILLISGCSSRNKYNMELKSAYMYDSEAQVLIKYPSEIILQPDELLSVEDGKTKTIDYQTVNLTFPKRNYDTGIVSDFNITVAYTSYNNNLIFTSVPIQSALYNYFTFAGSADTKSVVITIDKENAFLVDLKEASIKKLFNDDDFDRYFDVDAIKKLIFANVVSISPDGRYILYLSNRNYINDSPNSLDIYCYDMQTGTETNLMNFDYKEFLCWEKSGDLNNAGNFLFREINMSKTEGTRTYSDIRKYSITANKEDVLFIIDENYNNYEMIDDEYFYAVQNIAERTADDTIHKTTTFYIGNIYSGEVKSADMVGYTAAWNAKLSETKDYIAFYGSYINENGVVIADILTMNIETANIVPQYEQDDFKYYVDSFYWCPDNTFIVNFINNIDLYKDLCRFHKITHK